MNGLTDGAALLPVVHEIVVPPPPAEGDVQSMPSIVTVSAPLNPVPVIVTDSPPFAEIFTLERDVIVGVFDSLYIIPVASVASV